MQLTGTALEKTKTVTDADKLLAKGKLKVVCGLGMAGWILVDANGPGKTAAAQENVAFTEQNLRNYQDNVSVSWSFIAGG